jgi:hypothetical protein
MVPANYRQLTVKEEAYHAVKRLVVVMTMRYQRHFTISQAIVQAVEDLEPDTVAVSRREQLDL